jgi:hypothetical protein
LHEFKNSEINGFAFVFCTGALIIYFSTASLFHTHVHIANCASSPAALQNFLVSVKLVFVFTAIVKHFLYLQVRGTFGEVEGPAE